LDLNSKQRAYLRKMAHSLEPIVRIGKEGFGENTQKSIIDAITSRELIKVKLLQNCENKEEILTQISNWEEIKVVGTVGSIIVVYKENKDKPVVSLEMRKL